MSIVYERNEWEPELRYYFRSSFGVTPICELAKKGDHWEVLFYRGATNPGPHVYLDFEKAKRHIFAYLVPRENELMGQPAKHALAGFATYCGADRQIRRAMEERGSEPSPPVPKRRSRRRHR